MEFRVLGPLEVVDDGRVGERLEHRGELEVVPRRHLQELPVHSVSIEINDEDLPFVYLENADGSFARRRVTIGYRAGDRQEVTSGLASGERLVVEGGLFMQFAQSQ